MKASGNMLSTNFDRIRSVIYRFHKWNARKRRRDIYACEKNLVRCCNRVAQLVAYPIYLCTPGNCEKTADRVYQSNICAVPICATSMASSHVTSVPPFCLRELTSDW